MNAQSQKQRLLALGMSKHEATAFIALWDSDWLRELLNAGTLRVRALGYNAADMIDAVVHAFVEDEVLIYYQHGFTAHQAAMIAATPRAHANLFSDGESNVRRILAAAASRDFVVNALRVATSQREVLALLSQYADEARQAGLLGSQEGIDTKVRVLAALTPPPRLGCEHLNHR